MLEVFKPGSWVRISDDIPATIRQACVGGNLEVTYEVIWWDGRDRKSSWVSAYEVHATAPVTMQIGFCGG